MSNLRDEIISILQIIGLLGFDTIFACENGWNYIEIRSSGILRLEWKFSGNLDSILKHLELWKKDYYDSA